MKKPVLSRREFARRSAAAMALVAFPNVIPASVLGAEGRPGANSRINIAMIGTGNQGTNDLRNFLNDERIQIVAVCDTNRESAGYWDGGIAGREPAKRIIESFYAQKSPTGGYKGCDTYSDFREVLARKDIDVVEVATPDHWHAILAVEACKAGKDVYCQKPLSIAIAEGRAMADAVKRYKRVFQTGSQQRSDAKFRQACELVRNGRIGKLTSVKVGLPAGWPDYGKTANRKAPESVPEGFDYNMWLGPALDAPYAPARCHVNFRWIYDYSGGQVTDWGGHHPDIAQWGMDTERTGPVEIRNAKATIPPDVLWNTATEFSFDAVYANGLVMNISDKNKMGVTFIGEKGTIYVTRGQIRATPEDLVTSKIAENEIHLYKSSDHFRNFIDCVLSRKEPIAPAEVAHRSITICHLGNIAMRLHRDTLKWDPKKEQIIGDSEASMMLARPHRSPWKLEV